jgi:hypothetical protein
MITSTKNKSYLLSIMVSLVMLTLCSAAWSQDRQRLNVGILVITDRHNLRDDNGELISGGEDVSVALFLVVLDSTPPYTRILLVKSFNNNMNIINYLVNKGVLAPDTYVSTIEFSHKAEQNRIEGEIEIEDEYDTLKSKVKFIAPSPYAEPPQIPPEDPLVWQYPVGLHYNYDPTRLFAYSVSRTVYEPPVADVELKLKINVSDPYGETLTDEIFNSVNETNITRVRFMRQIQVTDEIVH